MNIGKENFILDLGNISVAVATLIILAGVSSPAAAQRRDDAVTSGTSRGAGKVVISTPASGGNFEALERPNYLLRGVLMGSTKNFYQSDILFGPFTNASNYPLSIAINHTGSQEGRYSNVFVDGYEIGYGQESTFFIVPPKSEYYWIVKDTHTITAWVMGNIVNNRNVGLPQGSEFEYPSFTRGAYAGCLENRGEEPVAYIYYYEATGAGMSDGSNAWSRSYEYIPEFKKILSSGPQPPFVGKCLIRYPIPPAQDGGDGGS